MTCDEAAKAKSDQLHVPIHCEAPSERRGFSLLSVRPRKIDAHCSPKRGFCPLPEMRWPPMARASSAASSRCCIQTAPAPDCRMRTTVHSAFI